MKARKTSSMAATFTASRSPSPVPFDIASSTLLPIFSLGMFITLLTSRVCGTRIFDTGVQYCVADLGAREMGWIKTAISDTVYRREQKKREMESWYAANMAGRFPGKADLLTLDSELSKLDSRFKRLWDARH